MTSEELSRLDKLYRLTTIHLSQIRSRSKDLRMTHDLNRLVARAHSLIYISRAHSYLARIVLFYINGFARAVARSWKFHLVASVLFFSAATVGFYLAQSDPAAAYALSMAGDVRLPGSSAEQLESMLRSGRDQTGGEKFLFVAQLFNNNTKVGFLAFALGVLAGIPTVYLLLYNGALIGSFISNHDNVGIRSEVWAWLLPHGVTEIGAILLCGGAGLMLGMAIVQPGHKTRTQSLKDAAHEAFLIAMGVIPMFLLAGFIESYVRQSHMTTEQRLGFALMTAVLWGIYFASGQFTERTLKRYRHRERQITRDL